MLRNMGKPVLIFLDKVGLLMSSGLIHFHSRPGRCLAAIRKVLSIPTSKCWGIFNQGATRAPISASLLHDTQGFTTQRALCSVPLHSKHMSSNNITGTYLRKAILVSKTKFQELGKK